ncbi:MAG: redoxin domain-containing protein [bacterium]|nr:redoxin domain-containing protein [bacterium]
MSKLKNIALKTANPFSKNIFFILILSLVAFVFLPITKGQAFKRLREGEPAIDFTLNDVNKNKINLKEFAGKNIATGVIFWNYNSENSLNELSVLQDLYNKYKSSGYNILAVYVPNSDKETTVDELDKVNKIITEQGITFPVLIDEGLKIYNQYGVVTTPSLAIMDIDNKILSIMPGYPKLSGERLVKKAFEKPLGIEIVARPKVAEGYIPKGKSQFYYNFGLKMFKLGFMEKAKEKLMTSLKEDENYSLSHSLLGRVFARQDNIDSASASFITAIDLDAKNVETHYYYAIVCRDANRIAESIGEFNQALTLAPKDPSIIYGLGTAFFKNGEKEKAKEKFIEAIKLFEENDSNNIVLKDELSQNMGNAFYDLANLYLDEKNTDEAISAFKKSNNSYKKFIEFARSDI